MSEQRASFCRTCLNTCPVLVTVEHGRAIGLSGDPENEVYRGYSCAKGRAQVARLSAPDRLLTPLKRDDGGFRAISVEQALDEIAGRLKLIRDRDGPDAIAAYFGTYTVANATAYPVGNALMSALGSSMKFTPNTIDKPGKNIAPALLGGWQAPAQGLDQPEVALLIGINPVVSYQGMPFGNPQWLGKAMARGMKLIVIDPRRSDVAVRAHLHLQPRPGHDAALLACLIRIVLTENLIDQDFVASEVTGLDALAAAVAPYTPAAVAALAGVETADLVSAAKIYAQAGRGYAIAGTGPSMSGPGTLVEYLVLVLQTLTGRWLRAGEVVRNAPTLMPAPVFRAQASPQRPARDLTRPMRVRGLTATPAGIPTAAIADEILQEGPGQIRALLSVGGNPVGAFPDQLKVIDAMKALELLVQVDPWMSVTAKLAHYVIPPLMALETASITHIIDGTSNRTAGLGSQLSYAQYTPAVVAPPAGSDLIEEWQFFHGVAQRMGLELTLLPAYAGGGAAAGPVPLPMDPPPSTEQLLELISVGSRVPLDTVRRHPHGSVFAQPEVRVAAKQPGWPHRLQVGHPDMCGALEAHLDVLRAREMADEAPFRLICRRSRGLYNTTVNDGLATRGQTHNPAFVHPDDLRELGLHAGDQVEVRSARAAIIAIAEPDGALRRGLVSMSHGFGELPGADDDPLRYGANVDRLIADDVDFDPWSGQPRMSNVPVHVRARSTSGTGDAHA